MLPWKESKKAEKQLAGQASSHPPEPDAQSSKPDSQPKSHSQRIYIPMGGAGFLFRVDLDDDHDVELATSLQQRTSLATSGVATCVGLILYHEATNSGMIAHFTSDNESEAADPAVNIVPEMIEKFVKPLDCQSQDLEAYICYRQDVEPRSTQNIVEQIEHVFDQQKVHFTSKVDFAFHGGWPATDIYLNFRTREAGIYEETFKESPDVVATDARHLSQACSETFPDTEHFEYFILESPLRFIPSSEYYPASEESVEESDEARSFRPS